MSLKIFGKFGEIPKFGNSQNFGDKEQWNDLALGNFGVHPPKSSKFGEEGREKGFNIFGNALGTWAANILGIFGEQIQENPQNSGRGRGKNIGKFAKSNKYLLT